MASTSECLSHSVIYEANPEVMSVIHIHSPDIWQQHQALKLVTTPIDAEYGTPEMAIAIQNCSTQSHQCIAMLGHLDGVICYADNLDTVG